MHPLKWLRPWRASSPHPARQLLFTCLWFLCVTGCDDGPLDPATPGALAPTLSGTVVDNAGNTVAGVRVVARERTSDERRETVTRKDGSFTMTPVQGKVYDLALNREGDPSTATCFYGPALPGEDNVWPLQSAIGRDPGEVFGVIRSSHGETVPGRKIYLQPVAIVSLTPGRSARLCTEFVPQPQSARTHADGSFALRFEPSRELNLNLEVCEKDDSLAEFIDVSGCGKPVYVCIALGRSTIKNADRAGQEPTLPASSTAASFRRFTLDGRNSDDPMGTLFRFSLQRGLLPLGSSVAFSGLSARFGPASRALERFDPPGATKSRVVLSRCHQWWRDTDVRFQVSIASDEPCQFVLHESNGSSYQLKCRQNPGTHFVQYHSNQPDIVRLDVQRNILSRRIAAALPGQR